MLCIYRIINLPFSTLQLKFPEVSIEILEFLDMPGM